MSGERHPRCLGDACGVWQYGSGCRCDRARAAKAAYIRARRAAARERARAYEEAQRARALAQLAEAQRRTGLPIRSMTLPRYRAPIRAHGTRYGYEEAGCRCEACTAARSAHDRDRAQRRRTG